MLWDVLDYIKGGGGGDEVCKSNRFPQHLRHDLARVFESILYSYSNRFFGKVTLRLTTKHGANLHSSILEA